MGAVGRRVAQAVLVGLSLGGALALGAQIATWPDHPLADMTHITHWVRNIAASGVESAYSGVYPETYMIYPPGMAYVYQLAAWLAAHLAPFPGVGTEDWLRVCIKLVPTAAHGLLALALFAGVALVAGFWRGWIALTLYAWSPAALFDTAYWGQGDAINVLLLVLAVYALFASPGWWPVVRAGRPRLVGQVGAIAAGGAAGVLIAAAGLTKPQSWVFLPLLIWVALRRTGPIGAVVAAATGGLVIRVLIDPWIRTGRVDEMLSVFTNVTQVMPSVSANAHNLWWLKLPGVALAVFDTTPVGGFGEWAMPPLLTHATLGRLAFGLFATLPLLRLTAPLSLRLVMACAAYTSAAYFMAVTQVHENHMFATIPFLAAAAALDAWFLLPFVIASVCVFFNMALHDFLVGDSLAAWLGQWLPSADALALQTANARLNVAGFAVFTLILLRRPPAGQISASHQRWRARLALAVGAVVGGGALAAARLLVTDPDRSAAVWERLAERALRAGPIEAHLGHKTPPTVLLEHAALEFANALYLFAGIAVVVGTVALLAGVWWLAGSRLAKARA